MYASLSTWRLDESIRADEAYSAFVGSVLRQTLPTAREIGILDAVIVRIADDTIVAMTVYESQDAADSAWQQAAGPMRELYDAKMRFVSRVAGRADDMPQLTEDE